MKKFCIVSALLLAVSLCMVSAVESDYKYEFQESKLVYHNVTVYKVLDHRQAYVVMYAKGHGDVGNVTIPKKWYKASPSKLYFRQLPKGMTPYMTIVNRDGAFDHVILTMPTSRANTAWGVADSNVVIDDADKDTLEIVY
ncbi:MAG: hypothetical protein J1E32_00480 [Treponema sp.]|nr:hypothetical protein [Treponema sp.]